MPTIVPAAPIIAPSLAAPIEAAAADQVRVGAAPTAVESRETPLTARVEPEGPDAAFGRIVDGMAAGFTHDLAISTPIEPLAPSLAADGIEEATPVAEAIPVAGPDAPAEVDAPTGRVTAALRLTSQAVQAWVSIFQQATPRP